MRKEMGIDLLMELNPDKTSAILSVKNAVRANYACVESMDFAIGNLMTWL
jgi:hypothetical protein